MGPIPQDKLLLANERDGEETVALLLIPPLLVNEAQASLLLILQTADFQQRIQ